MIKVVVHTYRPRWHFEVNKGMTRRPLWFFIRVWLFGWTVLIRGGRLRPVGRRRSRWLQTNTGY